MEQKTNYLLDGRGNAQAEQVFSLTNNFANIYPQEFLLSLPRQVGNILAWDQQGNILAKQEEKGKVVKLRLHFNEKVVGKGKKLTFHLRYFWPHLAEHRGQVWHLVLPPPENVNNFYRYDVSLRVPLSFRNLAHASVTPATITLADGYRLILFHKEQFSQGPIGLSFADFQAFDFQFKYSLRNTKDVAQEEVIPLPPETNYQEIIFKKLQPRPRSASIDDDGNWLALYLLPPHGQKEVVLEGQALLFPKPQQKLFYNQAGKVGQFLKATSFWPVNNKIIQRQAQNLKNARAIYNFVVRHLHYHLSNQSRRRGALDALEHPNNAVCSEFSDLFITLARAANIPSREIEGYAYSNDPQLKPGGRQILHAWPEYWDFARRMWIQVDPTWGNTTGGIDYFHSLDLNHFALVIHGHNDSLPPPPGSYSLASNGFEIRFAKNIAVIPQPKLELKPLFDGLDFSQINFHKFDFQIVVKNNSLAILENASYRLRLGDHSLAEGKFIIMPPFAEKKLTLAVTPWYFWRGHDLILTIQAGGHTFHFSHLLPLRLRLFILFLIYWPFFLFFSFVLSFLFYWFFRNVLQPKFVGK